MTEADRIAQKILGRLGELAAGKLPADRHSLPLLELEPLAREQVHRSAGRAEVSDRGHLYVTLAAARAYAATERIDDEEARRELTEMLLDAKESEARPGEYRYRNRATGLDITARAVREEKLLVVTSVSVRPHNSSGGRRG